MDSTPKSRIERGQNIKVFVRVRPLNENERRERAFSVVHTPGPREVAIRDKAFSFDKVFGVESSQPDVYKSVVAPLVQQVLQGYNCTVFAYGQTGTGKTHTMEGPPDDVFPDGRVPDGELGIIPRALNDIFDNLRMGETVESFVRVSFVELYNEEIFDLLSGYNDPTRLRLYDDPNKKGSVIIKDLNDVRVMDKREVYRILKKGSEKRRTAETKMNAHSSRSHTIFTVTVYMYERSVDGDEVCKIGKLNLVDLAGSENIGRSGAADKQAREAGNINQSLLTLGRVITSLVAGGSQHVPYRESKLTRLLQDSLGGRTKTSIIATVSPASCNIDLTLSTLDYAQRAKKITNKPEINLKISNKEKIMEYQAKIDRLQAELQAVRDKEGAVYLPREMYEDQNKRLESQEEEIREITKTLKTLETLRDELTDAMSALKDQLSVKEAKLGETSNALNFARDLLQKTKFEKKEMEFLVERHIDTEEKLRKQAERLLVVSTEATGDREKLHDKLERKINVEQSNETSSNVYRESFDSNNEKLKQIVCQNAEKRLDFGNKMFSDLEQSRQRRETEMCQIKSTYSESVLKVIEKMGEIELISKNDTKQEQAWMNDVLKRLKNDSDLQSESFNHFLHDKLYTVLDGFLQSFKQLKNIVEEHSRSTDLILSSHTSEVQKYLLDASLGNNRISELNLRSYENLSNSNNLVHLTYGKEENYANEYHKETSAVLDEVQGLMSRLQSAQQLFKTRSESSRQAITSEITKAISEVDGLKETLNCHKEEFVSKRQRFETALDEDKKKFFTEKSKAMKSFEATASDISHAVEIVRSEADQFVSRGKKAWIQKYEETEKDLLKRNKDSAVFNSSLKEHSETVERISRASLSQVHDLVDASRKSDKKIVRDQQSTIKADNEAVQEFSETLQVELDKVQTGLEKFFTSDLRRDLSTGQTPLRVQSSFPKNLVAGTPDDERLNKFRQKMSVADITPLKFDFDEDEEDSLISSSTNILEDRNSMSRQNSFGSVKNQISESEGYLSDKENSGNNVFAKPKSKLKPPTGFNSRSSSKSRQFGSNTNLQDV